LDLAVEYNENLHTTKQQMADFFFICRQISFHTGTTSFDPWDRKSVPPKTGIRYYHIPFKKGFTIPTRI